MRAQFFFDIECREGAGAAPVLLSQAWRQLHTRAARHEHVVFAVDFPGVQDLGSAKGFALGRTLRAFTEEREAADSLADALDRLLDANTHLVHRTRAALAPQAAGQPGWRIWNMQRLSGLRLPAATPLQERQAAMARRFELVEQQRARQAQLPFVWMRSSTGQVFKLVLAQQTTEIAAFGEPNGYGLSRKSQQVSVPVV
jgi:CRISPR-associated endoribonuclease Cas6/Csy4 subtype I-F